MTASILVVEDEAIIAHDIVQTLVDLGFEVAGTARSGEEAIDLALSRKPSLALLDIKLAGQLTGIDVAHRVRASLGLPVVFLTSHSNDGLIREAAAAGPHGYLVKPFSDRDLKSTIEVALARHKLESELVARERWLSTTLNSIGDAVVATNPAQSVIFLNPAAEEMTGWPALDAIGRSISDVVQLERVDGPAAHPVARALSTAASVEFEPGSELITRHGKRKQVKDTAAPIRGERDEVLGCVMVVHDVTEQRAMAQTLARTERLAALGTLSAGLMHEINNPLAYAMNGSSWALETLREMVAEGADARLREVVAALEETEDGMNRIRRLVQDCRRFGRGEVPARAMTSLAEIVEPAIRMARGSLSSDARIWWDAAASPLVEADAAQLTQVVVNLLTNASDAHVPGRATEIVVSSGTMSDGGAFIDVRDNGRGMTAEVISQIFDPFFTTKPIGQGMGLGLSISHRIVTDHGGRISVDSEVGVGTSFLVHLPAALRAPVSKPPLKAMPLSVLVVGENSTTAGAIHRQLQPHEVTAEAHSSAAIARLLGGARYDAILCNADITDDAVRFRDAVSAVDPAQAERIVFMRADGEPDEAELASRSIVKPFSGKDVVAAVTSAARATNVRQAPLESS